MLERDAALSQLEATKASLVASQDEAQKRAGENESLIASLRTEVSALQEALVMKTDAVVALEQEMLRTESDSRLTVMQVGWAGLGWGIFIKREVMQVGGKGLVGWGDQEGGKYYILCGLFNAF